MNDGAGIVPDLAALFASTFNVDMPGEDTDLLESGLLDSLQLVELLVQTEGHFGLKINIDDIDLEDLRTLRGIAGLIVRAGKPAEPEVVQVSALASA